jgi:hypothetical protein
MCQKSAMSITYYLNVHSNLCTTTTLGTPNLLPLLTGGCCLGIGFFIVTQIVTPK